MLGNMKKRINVVASFKAQDKTSNIRKAQLCLVRSGLPTYSCVHKQTLNQLEHHLCQGIRLPIVRVLH